MLLSLAALANDTEEHLRDQYRGKIFVQRAFYSEPHMLYDATGTLASGGAVGDWTTDAFIQINDIHTSGSTLKIKATRLMVVSVKRKGFQFSAVKLSKRRKDSKNSGIAEIEASSASDSEQAAKVFLSKIFLDSQDSFVDYVPDYWRPCVEDGMLGKSEDCRFSSEMLAVPGVAIPAGRQSSSEDMRFRVLSPPGSSAAAAMPAGLFKVGHGVTAPKATYQPEPSFSEPARRAKYEGTVTMGLIVDKDGLPKKIHIISPLGAGLDAKAVQAVETWKFQPAKKDGVPVPVTIAVEVYFHLY